MCGPQYRREDGTFVVVTVAEAWATRRVPRGFCLEASPFPDANPSAWAALQQWSTVPTVRKVTTACVWVGFYWTRIVQVQASPPCKLSVLENK